MSAFFETLAAYWPEMWQGSLETLFITFVSVLFAYLIGMPVGVLLITSKKDGIRPNKTLNAICAGIVNIGRSIPFVILLMALMPLTQLLTGTSIGTEGILVPLIVAAAPFVARMVEQTLEEIDPGVVEAAKTMGATNWQIIYKVLLPESVPSLIRGLSITTITVVGYTALAGMVGGGGLGAVAVNYGLYRYDYTVMYIAVILLMVIVFLFQLIFNCTAKAIDKRNR